MTFRPAQGLQRLTWAQVEQLDARIAALCTQTEGGSEARLVLVIKKGKIRFVETRLSEELSPIR